MEWNKDVKLSEKHFFTSMEETDDDNAIYEDEESVVDSESLDFDVQENDFDTINDNKPPSEEILKAISSDSSLSRLYIKKPLEAEPKNSEKYKQRYARLAYIANHGTPEEVKDAQSDAIFYMSWLISSIARHKFWTYIKNDHTFLDDLFQDGSIAIIENLPRYNSDLALPQTFFFLHILSPMGTRANKDKHNLSNAYSRIRKNIMKVEALYPDGATLADIQIETGLPYSKIRDARRVMVRSSLTSLNAPIEDESDEKKEVIEIISGDSRRNEDYELPETLALRNEMLRIITEKISNKFGSDASAMYIKNKVMEYSVHEVALDYPEFREEQIRRLIEKITQYLSSDTSLRALFNRRYGYAPRDLSLVLVPAEGTRENIDILASADIF